MSNNEITQIAENLSGLSLKILEVFTMT